MVKINDSKLKFDEASHTYKVGKKKLCSVTEWIGEFFPKFDADAISLKMATKKIGRFKGGEEDEPAYDLAVQTAQEEILHDWDVLRDTGTEIHQQVEDWYNSRKEPTHIKAKMGVNWAVLNPHKGYGKYPEARIYSEELGLAGTIDLLLIEEEETLGYTCYTKPRVTLVDWKSNKEIRTQNPWEQTDSNGALSHLHNSAYNKYALQLSVYGYMLEKEYGFIVDKLLLVHLTEDKYVEMPMDYMRETVKKMLGEKRK